jgi:hypothetical protein
MGTLVYVCPVTDLEVATGIEMDLRTFESLYDEIFRCPYCQQLHQLGGIRIWLAPPKDVELRQNQVA